MFSNRLLIFKNPEGPGKSPEAAKPTPEKPRDNQSPEAKAVESHFSNDDGADVGQCTKGSCEIKPSSDYEKAIKESGYNKVEPSKLESTVKPGAIVVVSAEWCPKCPKVLRTVAEKNPGKQLIVVDYDEDDAGLDEKFGHEGGVPKVAVATGNKMSSAKTGNVETVYDDITKQYTAVG